MVDWTEIRKDFPAAERFRYFYTASGGPIPRPVYEQAKEYYRQALEEGDRHWESNLERREEVRRLFAKLIAAQPEEVEFVSSTAAAMNFVADQLNGDGEVIATTLEFPDTTLPWLMRRADCIRWIEPDDSGAVPIDELCDCFTPETATIATSHVQFSNGFRQDLHELGSRKGRHWLVVNSTQSLGAFRIDVKEMQIDALAANSYKWLLAGYGCGLLYLSKRILRRGRGSGVGWFSVKDRVGLRNDRFELLESAARFNLGSPSFPVIFSLGAALEYLLRIGIDAIQQRVLYLNRCLTEQLQGAGYNLLSPLDQERYRSAETLIELQYPQRTVQALAEENILCTVKPEGMRVATHFFVNEEDIDALITCLVRIEPPGRK